MAILKITSKNFHRYNEKVIEVSFPLDEKGAKLSLTVEYDSRKLIEKVDEFNFIYKLRLLNFSNFDYNDIVEVKIPNDYHFSSYPKEKFIMVKGEKILRYNQMSIAPNFDEPIEIKFSKDGLVVYDILKWFTRGLVLIGFCRLIFILIKKRKVLSDKYLLKVFTIIIVIIQIILGYLDLPSFIDGFCYTNSYLYIVFFISSGVVILFQNFNKSKDLEDIRQI